MCLELEVEEGKHGGRIFSPVRPEVGGDVGVEVGVAVVQGEGEGEQEPAQTGEKAGLVVECFHCSFVLTDSITFGVSLYLGLKKRSGHFFCVQYCMHTSATFHHFEINSIM